MRASCNSSRRTRFMWTRFCFAHLISPPSVRLFHVLWKICSHSPPISPESLYRRVLVLAVSGLGYGVMAAFAWLLNALVDLGSGPGAPGIAVAAPVNRSDRTFISFVLVCFCPDYIASCFIQSLLL